MSIRCPPIPLTFFKSDFPYIIKSWSILSKRDFFMQLNVEPASTKQFEPVHEISNDVVSATSKGLDQPAHTCSLIRAFACRLNIL